MIEIRKATIEDAPVVHAMGENVDEFHTSDHDIAAIKTYEKAGFSRGEVFLWLDV